VPGDLTLVQPQASLVQSKRDIALVDAATFGIRDGSVNVETLKLDDAARLGAWNRTTIAGYAKPNRTPSMTNLPIRCSQTPENLQNERTEVERELDHRVYDAKSPSTVSKGSPDPCAHEDVPKIPSIPLRPSHPLYDTHKALS
jgi:hypothetical protein